MGHFRGSKNPHFQNEATCTTFLVKMSFICMRMKNHFHIKGWALNLVLIKRPGETREWLIIKVVTELRTVSLCRIARENLVNYGDATIYYNIMIKVLVFRNYLVFDEPHFLKKLGGNLRDLLLIRGTQRQFSENICSEDNLRSTIFGTFIVKFLACLPLLRFSNIYKMV